MKPKPEWLVFRHPETNVILLRRFDPRMGAAPQFYQSGKHRYVYVKSTSTAAYLKHEYSYMPSTASGDQPRGA